MNQLPSEIFLLRSVLFLIKLSCKKLPPSLVKCVFFASMYPRQVKMSNVYLNFFCLNFRWGEKLDIKIWLYCFQFPRVQILLFVGWKSTRVKKRRKVKASEKFCSQFVVVLSTIEENGDDDTAATNFSQGRCLSQSTGTLPHVVKIPLPKFKDLMHKKIVVGSYRPRTVLYPSALTRLQIKVFVCFRLFR